MEAGGGGAAAGVVLNAGALTHARAGTGPRKMEEGGSRAPRRDSGRHLYSLVREGKRFAAFSASGLKLDPKVRFRNGQKRLAHPGGTAEFLEDGIKDL